MSRKKRDPGVGAVNSMAARVVFGKGTRGPDLDMAGLLKIIGDYVRAGVRGEELIQRVINSAGGEPSLLRSFLLQHYPDETRGH